MAARDFLSIGEVLINLKPEFPDVTISKIRFLESEGLIAPDRTESGYRKFYDRDLERLREILRLQREEYLPLKVIKERLEQSANGPRPAVEEKPVHPEDEVAPPMTDVQMTGQELAQATGAGLELIEELESFGFLRPQKVGEAKFYDGDALVILRILTDFFRFGIEPRHLTMYKHFADREAGFFEAIILPVLRQRNPDARKQAGEALTELAAASRKLKAALLRANLRRHVSGP